MEKVYHTLKSFFLKFSPVAVLWAWSYMLCYPCCLFCFLVFLPFHLVLPVYPGAKLSDSFLSFYCFSISQILKIIPTLLSMLSVNWVPKNAATFPSTGVSSLMDAMTSSRPAATHTAISADSTMSCLQAVMQWFDSHCRCLCQGSQINAIACSFLSHPLSHLSAFLLQEPIICTRRCDASFSI